MSPILDLFITLLSMGEEGYLEILKNRIDLIDYFKENIIKLSNKYNEILLNTNNNTISYTMTLNNFENPSLIGIYL
jgi:O-phospho-L-seryl-tRNASec:L-selenocysteinyl-tRNA synthase